MGICCVEGCQDLLKDTVYFEFPTSRSLRRKWLDVLKIGNKVPIGTVVCSQHFHSEEYEIVRGKVRLKRKVVPTLLLQEKSPEIQPTETLCKDKKENSVLPDEKIVENLDPPQPDSTTGNTVSANSSDTLSVEPVEDLMQLVEDNGESTKMCQVVNKDITIPSRTSIDRESVQPDPKQPPDFEDMITNYQIKNSKPHSLLPQAIELEVPACEGDGAILLDDKEDAPPVFVEISVDKDCLMVLESVQVEVDPSSLMLPEQEESEPEEEAEREFKEDVKPPDKIDDPISLLTSSDEDDVIIQEPHIDTVEVSDETDEDDMPLVKLVKKKPSKKKSKKIKKEVAPQGLNNLVWNGAYDFYCMQCRFSTADNLEYNQHLKEHEKGMQVCSECAYTTSRASQFARHLRKHKEEKKYKCHLCEYRAKHNMSLIYHMQSHRMDRNYLKIVKKGYKCRKCGYRAELETLALKHVRMCRRSVKVFSCSDCEYVTKKKADLKRHWMKRHPDKIVDVDLDSSSDPDVTEE